MNSDICSCRRNSWANYYKILTEFLCKIFKVTVCIVERSIVFPLTELYFRHEMYYYTKNVLLIQQKFKKKTNQNENQFCYPSASIMIVKWQSKKMLKSKHYVIFAIIIANEMERKIKLVFTFKSRLLGYKNV